MRKMLLSVEPLQRGKARKKPAHVYAFQAQRSDTYDVKKSDADDLDGPLNPFIVMKEKSLNWPPVWVILPLATACWPV
eukprot:scaffold7058_cov74-Skeletonema_dohrnii-CCMP3373.AAC.2